MCPGPEGEKVSRPEDDRSCWPVGTWMVLCNYPVVDDGISISSSINVRHQWPKQVVRRKSHGEFDVGAKKAGAELASCEFPER